MVPVISFIFEITSNCRDGAQSHSACCSNMANGYSAWNTRGEVPYVAVR